MKIIPAKVDFCAKELFENEVVRKYFISDVLQIPPQTIQSVKIRNPFLRKRRRRWKQGILDVLVELNDDTKINIEIQIKASKHWDKRELFYVAKVYVMDLLAGEDYSKLKRSVSISILDFNLTEQEEYHNVYLFRDEKGNIFSDMMEIHTIELRKTLKGESPVDDWIRLFNAQSEEELDMIQSVNPGIQEAIRELKRMSLSDALRERYEAHMKRVRDRKAQDEYVWDAGVARGMEQGDAQRLVRSVENTMETLHVSAEEACRIIGTSKDEYERAKAGMHEK